MKDEPDQSLEDDYLDYEPYNDKTDNYNYDNESQYYYDPKPFILGVNNNTTPQ